MYSKVTRLPVFSWKYTRCIPQRGEVIGFVDLHDLVALLVLRRMQAEREVEAHLVVPQLPDHFGDARR